MRKIFFPILSIALVGVLFASVSSCKQDITDRFEYQVEADTIKPEINISVPAQNQSYLYGNHVAIVGTITDLESEKNDVHDPGFRKGELKAVSITVDDLTNGTKLLVRNPSVLGNDGYGFNERVEIVTGSGKTNCRLIIVATDSKDHTVRDTVDFEYN